MRILVTERQLKLLEQNKTPQEQLDDFNYQEDKIKSSFTLKKNVKKWLTHLENKYPSLSFKLEYGNDVLIAKAKIKNINESKDISDSPLGKRVKVYYNLNKHTFSVTYKSLVILHADYVKLNDVEFKVRPGGKERVRKEKSKNVHAFVIGNLIDYCEFPCENLPTDSLGNVVTYNPYKYDTFVYKDSEEPIYNAKEIEMINLKNKLFVINEITQK